MLKIKKIFLRFRNLLIFENLIYILIFNLYLFLAYYYFTPPNNLIFWGIDSRLNIEEFIQILNPSSLWDFVFDSAYGNFTVYGRIFQFTTSIFMFLLSIFTNFSYPVLAFITQIFIMYLGLLLLTKKIVKDQNLRYLVLINLLIVCVEAKVLIKTTALEMFVFSIAIYFIHSKKNFLTYLFFGILAGIKFTNIIYPVIFFIITIKSIKTSSFFKNLFSGLMGLILAQPFVLTTAGFKVYTNFLIETINYKENYLIGPKDWMLLIENEFNIIFLLPFILFLLFNIKNLHFNKYETFLIIAPLFQILSYLFSDNLIRTHYLNLPMCILLVIVIEKTPIKMYIKYFVLIIYFLINFNYFINSSEGQANIRTYSTYSNVMEVLYQQDQYIAMNKTNEYVLNDLRTSEDKLIWWQVSDNIRPYSAFHWGSTENPLDADYYYKDIWGDPRGFPNDRCADYGGIVVLVLGIDDIEKVTFDFKKKGFDLVKSIPILNNKVSFSEVANFQSVLPKKINDQKSSYYVFYNSYNMPPLGC